MCRAGHQRISEYTLRRDADLAAKFQTQLAVFGKQQGVGTGCGWLIATIFYTFK
jgi:hypothetical protein